MSSPPIPICPRCTHYVPSDTEPGARVGEPSRAPDAEGALVCDACSLHESWLAMSDLELSAAAWPVEVPDRFYGSFGWCGC